MLGSYQDEEGQLAMFRKMFEIFDVAPMVGFDRVFHRGGDSFIIRTFESKHFFGNQFCSRWR
jgi:hypothetical protein